MVIGNMANFLLVPFVNGYLVKIIGYIFLVLIWSIFAGPTTDLISDIYKSVERELESCART